MDHPAVGHPQYRASPAKKSDAPARSLYQSEPGVRKRYGQRDPRQSHSSAEVDATCGRLEAHAKHQRIRNVAIPDPLTLVGPESACLDRLVEKPISEPAELLLLFRI